MPRALTERRGVTAADFAKACALTRTRTRANAHTRTHTIRKGDALSVQNKHALEELVHGLSVRSESNE